MIPVCDSAVLRMTAHDICANSVTTLYAAHDIYAKLRDPDGTCAFQAAVGGKFAPLIGMRDEDIDTMITTYNTALTNAASEILGKERRRKKPWITKDVLELCNERRDWFKQYLFNIIYIVTYNTI